MTITATRTTTNLSDANFTPVTGLIDPADGRPVDAFTAFNFAVPRLTRIVDGRSAMAETLAITISPNSQKETGITVAGALLSHEQFHYDVGFVVARQVARELGHLRGRDDADLLAKVQQLNTYHFRTRTGLIQRRYDIDSRHGLQAHFQRVWKDRMTACLADARATQIGGFFL